VLRALRPRRLFLPAYLCPVLIDVAHRAGTPVELYPVDLDLRTDPDALADAGPRDAVLAIHYFGFANPLLAALARRPDPPVLIEDGAQAFLSGHVGRHGAFALYSPRKFLGLPDGGLLWDRDGRIPRDQALEPPPVGWWLGSLRAGLLRRDHDVRGGEPVGAAGPDREWYRLSKQANDTDPVGAYRMSDLSRAILLGGTDFRAVAERRRANYARLAAALWDIAIFPELPDDVVPLGFPVRVLDRDAVRARLYADDVYPAVHWPLTGAVPAGFTDSHALERAIMTIPCDQRYDEADMRRIGSLVRAAGATPFGPTHIGGTHG
jgi:dTDP-4-amino-4,6-dideoxygalactose transaminase